MSETFSKKAILKISKISKTNGWDPSGGSVKMGFEQKETGKTAKYVAAGNKAGQLLERNCRKL